MKAPESLSLDEENPANRKWLKTVMKPALAVPNLVLQVYIHASSLVTASARFLPS